MKDLVKWIESRWHHRVLGHRQAGFPNDGDGPACLLCECEAFWEFS